MCDPFTMIALAVGGIGSMMMAGQSMPEPPKAEAPAPPEPISSEPAPEVKLGTVDDGVEDRIVPSRLSNRVTANTLGNLGRSSLSI